MQKSFAELEKISRKQSETIRQQNQIMENQSRDLQMKAQQLEIEKMQFEASKHADIRHNFLQMADFAIRTLPWWKRSPKAIVNRATELMFAIKHETAKHVAMDVLVSKAQEEQDTITLTNEQTENEKIVPMNVNTVSTNQNGDTEINATMDRESAELEQA